MKLSIEEIEKLDRERTQGEWICQRATPVDYPDIEHQVISTNKNEIICDAVCYYPQAVIEEDQRFIAAAPTITAQYIKARRFEVTEDFVNNVLESLQKKTGYYHGKDYWGMKREVISEAFKVMWEEIENG